MSLASPLGAVGSDQELSLMVRWLGLAKVFSQVVESSEVS